MSAHLKAFIVVFVVSIAALLFFRKPFANLIGRKRIDNWSITWLIVTACAFLITNYWLFIVVSAVVIFILSRSEPLKPAIYLLLLSVAPTLGEFIPGFAGIQKFIEVNPQLVTATIVLLPALFTARHMKKIHKTGGAADLFFLIFLLLQIALTIRAPSFTHVLRTAIQEFLAIAPLYYVFSRYPKSFEDIRVLSAAFVFPVLVLSAISIPEFIRNWHFYYSVSTNWFGAMQFGYILREGYLRASVSAFNPIVWGFIAMCGIGVGLAVLNDKIPRLYRFAGFGLLVSGLIVSLSRGPWIGAIAMIATYILLSQKMIKRAVQAGLVTIIAGVLSLLTPFGQNVIGLLPFIGGDNEGTIGYRRQLLNQAWDVILANPFFGSADFLETSALQSMRQGQGIIDIVNTYLQVGLKSGLVGLGLFLGIFASVLLALHKAMKSARTYDPLLANYCRAYLATLVGILLTIFTTSSEGQIPYIYWTFAGLGVALARVEQSHRADTAHKSHMGGKRIE
jgi:O-antigen ligase